MSTNFERALDLADRIAEVDESPRELVKQLRDAGLLAPDLPEPVIEYGDRSWGLWEHFDEVCLYENTVYVCGVPGSGGSVPLSPDEAERFAHALLAAVKRQKEQE